LLPRWFRNLTSTAVCLTALLALVRAHVSGAESTVVSPAEVRALWVTRSTLTTPAAIARMVRAAQSGGFNTLVVQVRGRGDAYYRSTLEPRPSDLARAKDFDPLAETLAHAKPAGIEVHAWVSVNLVSSAVNLPTTRQHLIHRHPEWLMVPRELAGELSEIDVRSPKYVARLARWTRARPTEVEGLYASPVHAGAAAHVTTVIADLVKRYDVDGVHLDYVRFPSADFDYSRATLQQFKLLMRGELSQTERQRADRQEATNPLTYVDRFPQRWLAFRQSQLTALVARIRTAVKAVRPGIVLSAAVVPQAKEAAHSRLQDWRLWLEQGLVDALCPMAYTPESELFEQQIRDATELAGATPVWAGIGAYRLLNRSTLSHIAAARRQKAAGIILFSYDALVSPPNSATTLAELGRAAFGGRTDSQD
jgi:uncharacterized lipoprotein YddW (UPF0748 family)